MPELDEAVQALVTEHSTDDLAKALQAHAREVWQVAYNDGHRSGASKQRRDVEEAEKSLATVQGDLDEANKRITKMEDDQPDLASIREEHRQEIDKLTGSHKTELSERDEKVTRERLRNARSRLAYKLEHERGVDPEYAGTILVSKEEVQRRLTFNEDGSLVVLQNGKDIELVGTDKADSLSLLAEELSTGVDAKWLSSKAGAGSGVRPPGAASSGKGDYFDKLRERQKAKLEAVGDGDNRQRALERLGRA